MSRFVVGCLLDDDVRVGQDQGRVQGHVVREYRHRQTAPVLGAFSLYGLLDVLDIFDSLGGRVLLTGGELGQCGNALFDGLDGCGSLRGSGSSGLGFGGSLGCRIFGGAGRGGLDGLAAAATGHDEEDRRHCHGEQYQKRMQTSCSRFHKGLLLGDLKDSFGKLCRDTHTYYTNGPLFSGRLVPGVSAGKATRPPRVCQPAFRTGGKCKTLADTHR